MSEIGLGRRFWYSVIMAFCGWITCSLIEEPSLLDNFVRNLDDFNLRVLLVAVPVALAALLAALLTLACSWRHIRKSS